MIHSNRLDDSSKNHTVDSSLVPINSGHFIKCNESPQLLSFPVTEIGVNGSQLYKNKSSDNVTLSASGTTYTTEPLTECSHTPMQNNHAPPQTREVTSMLLNTHFPSKSSLILNNQNNVRNKIFNVDITQESFNRLHIEDFPMHLNETEELPESNKIPTLANINSSYQDYNGKGSIVTQGNNISSRGQSLTPTLSTVILGNGHCQTPKDLEIRNSNNRQHRGYAFHTFGHTNDSSQ